MSTDELLERLHQATAALCRDGAIKDRLADAYATYLSPIDRDHVPIELRTGFDELRTAMNRALPLPRESVVRASVRKMSGEEATRHAEYVVRLFAGVARGARPVRVTRAAVRAPRRTALPTPLASTNVSPIVKLFAKES